MYKVFSALRNGLVPYEQRSLANLSDLRDTIRSLAVRAALWGRDAAVREWCQSRRIFFVLALGRSGSALLARLLDRDPAACVVHEPVAGDPAAYRRAFWDATEAERYVSSFRCREMFLRSRRHHASVYGEVNSHLRRHCDALRETFPQARMMHLVRDGRGVVRSMMSRGTLSERDCNTRGVAPDEKDPWRPLWPEMDRFRRVCWYWQNENRHLRERLPHRVRLESLLTSYETLDSSLLAPLGLRVTRDDWEQATRVPTNATRRHLFPHWKEWADQQRRAFAEICGEEMEANGYSL